MKNTKTTKNTTYECRFIKAPTEQFLVLPFGSYDTPIKLAVDAALTVGLVDGDYVTCTVEDGKVTAVTLKQRENYCVTGRLGVENGISSVYTANFGALPAIGAIPESCHVGDIVLAMLNKSADGVFISESLGSSTEPESNYNALVAGEKADIPFLPDAIMQARQSAFTEINTLMANRTDLRGKTIITLSATESSRTECGFSVELDKNGNYLLGLHTADVAVFVPENSALDREAAERGKTVVLPNTELLMLPETLSKGPCFLAIGEDRLALSYFLTISPDGKVLALDFCESIIKTAANCLFDEVDALILNYDNSAIMPLRTAYASVMPTISLMFALGGILQNARVQNGGCEFDKLEQTFVYGKHGGKPIGVISEQLSDPKKLIREFLAVAGKELALYLNSNNIPAIYRIQDAPNSEKLSEFRNYVSLLGINTDGVDDRQLLTYVTEAAHGLRAEQLIIKKLRSTLPKASFSDVPVRSPLHGTEMFLRFAYPLNRYADLCIQRIVKAIINANNGEKLDRDALYATARRGICSAVRAKLRVARIENGCEELAALAVLRKIGKKPYNGIVSAVNNGTVSVLLDNGCVGTLVANSAEYKIGDSVTVTPAEFDFENSKMLLSIA